MAGSLHQTEVQETIGSCLVRAELLGSPPNVRHRGSQSCYVKECLLYLDVSQVPSLGDVPEKVELGASTDTLDCHL